MRIMLKGSRVYRGLDGKKYVEKAEITRETERAYLLEITRGPVVHKYWIPKSISLRLESFIEVPDWFWGEAEKEQRIRYNTARGGRR
jgi:hypothetical protein